MMLPTPTISCLYCNASNPTNASVCVTCGSRIIAEPNAQKVLDDSLPTGATLGKGRFQILNEIARGGFGITYMAYDTQVKSYVAIKECFPEGLVTRGSSLNLVPNLGSEIEIQAALIQFQVEANVLKKLEHPSADPPFYAKVVKS
jgi:serine/threonine protein kinase